MWVRRSSAVFLFFLLFAPSAFAKLNSESKRPDQFICNTGLDRTDQALAIGRFNQQQLADKRTLDAVTEDRGNIAVLQDDGTILTTVNRFDLANRSIIFTPAGSGYSIITESTVTFDEGAGNATTVELVDDDTSGVTLPFPFVFYGVRYTSVFLNTDGNLTFTEADTESTARNLRRIQIGPPRISPFFNDLNPIAPAGITVEKLADRVLFTWTDVGEYTNTGSRGRNTFQAVLGANGVIRFNYRTLDAAEAIVALAPGQVSSARIDLIDFSAQTTPATLGGIIAEVFAAEQDLDLTAVGQAFYRTHRDAYDGLIVFTDFDLELDDGFAFALPLRNSIRGIINVGRETRDFGAAFGSAQRLSVLVHMGALLNYPSDPRQVFLGANDTMGVLGQEFGHRWLAFLDFNPPVLLGRQRAHWSFLHHTSGSVMEGNDIQDLGDGKFKTGRGVYRYSPLDQYVMGLRAASEVPPWFAVINASLVDPPPRSFPRECRNDASALPACGPFEGVELTGTRRDVTIEEIIATAGVRTPGSEQAQRDFRAAFILITQRGRVASASSLAQLEAIRTTWQTFFADAVDRRGTMATELLYVPPAITSVSPARSPVAGGTAVTIRGSGFERDSVVLFGGRAGTTVFRDFNTLEATAPARPEGPAKVSVVVRNPRDGQSVMLDSGFTYFTAPISEITTTVAANGSRRFETAGLDASIQVGYATLQSAYGIAVFKSLSGSDVRSEAAVPAASTGTSFTVFIERTPQTSTGIAIVNPGTTAASLTLQLNNGRQTTLALPARGQKSQFVHEMFTDIGTSFLGSLSVRSNVPIAVVALRGTLNLANEFLITTVPLSSGPGTNDVAVFPQIADGAGYATELLLLNPADTRLTGTVEFSFSVATTDRGTNTRFSYDIAPGASWKLRTAGAAAAVKVGFASLIPAAGTVTPPATAVLSQTIANNIRFDAGVPAQRSLTRGLMLGERQSGRRSVIAISGTADVRLSAFKADGTPAAPPSTFTVSGHRSAFFDELIANLPANFDGTIAWEATAPVYVITLRTLVNASGEFLMTPMPVIDLAQPPPGTAYFPQLADGGNFTTEFFLFSVGATSARLQLFDPQGRALPLSLR